MSTMGSHEKMTSYFIYDLNLLFTRVNIFLTCLQSESLVLNHLQAPHGPVGIEEQHCLASTAATSCLNIFTSESKKTDGSGHGNVEHAAST